MADIELPAAKLHKVAAGDVAEASSLMTSDTPPAYAPRARGQTGDEVTKEPADTAALTSGSIDKGKKKKVALYVAYIGAGYHVSYFAEAYSAVMHCKPTFSFRHIVLENPLPAVAGAVLCASIFNSTLHCTGHAAQPRLPQH